MTRIPLIIKGQDDNGERFQIAFSVPALASPRAIYRLAVTMLWEDRWTPGSIEWQVYGVMPRPLADIPLGVGENYQVPWWGCRKR